MKVRQRSCLVIVIFLLFLDLSFAEENVTKPSRSTDAEKGFEDPEDQLSDSAFSQWSDWSRCSRQCKQFRSRLCMKSNLCKNRTQKLFRACHTSKCRSKLLVMANPGNSEEGPSKSRVMLHLQQYIYSEWSNWSSCSKSCYTKRTRSCRILDICGQNSLQEDYKSCYREGDLCETLYLESLQQSSDANLTTEDSSSVHYLDNIKCGFADVNAEIRIVGGRKAFKDSWPWQALILNRYREPLCGGVLLSDSWVLTAAHCVRRKLHVRAGEFDLAEIEGSEQEERVEATFVYPDYNPDTVDNDLALLKLRAPFQLNRHVKPVCLPEPDDELPLYARMTILGWGKRRNAASYFTDVLHQAEVPVVPTEKCRDSYDGYFISENMLCAGYDKGRVDSCTGDSGGPLLHRGSEGNWIVFGVTSFGEGCGRKKKFGVYASVVRSVNWIRHIIAT